MQIYQLFIFLLLTYSLESSIILDTVYGPLTVDDPLAIELIESTPFQRLKAINQYGFTPFLKPSENYKRYEHSIGVYAILKKHQRPQVEQIAGLLHDVSHTVFSHVGDYVFGNTPGFSAYQDKIHSWYIKESGLETILNKYNIAVQDIIPENFPFLKNKLPNLCADRLDYNLQGGFLRGLISKNELQEIWNDLDIQSEHWVFSSEKNAEILANASLIMTETLWGSPWESIVNRMGAKAIKYAIEKEIITAKDFHFSEDNILWEKLEKSEDSFIDQILFHMKQAENCFILTEKGKEDFMLFEKFRGINPLIKKEEKLVRLTDLSPDFASNFYLIKEKMENGWPIIWLNTKKIIEIH